MYIIFMKKYKIILNIFIIISLLFLGPGLLGQESKFIPRVFYKFLNHPIKDDFSKSGVKIFLQVPYNDLTFLKNDDYYTAAYEVNIIVRDEEKSILDKTFENSFSVIEFEETNSDLLFSYWDNSLELIPKKYEIEIIFKDKNSGNTSKGKIQKEMKQFDKNSINLSDLIFLHRIAFLPNDVVKLIPAPENNISIDGEKFYAYFEMYLPNESDDINIKFNVFDELDDHKLIKSGIISLKNKKNYEYFYTDLKNLNLEMGRYTIAYQIEQSDEKVKTNSSFSVGWEGLPISIDDFDKAVDQLKYIASRKETNAIKKAKGKEKLNAFKEFWSKRDSKPDTKINEKMVEYYKRINFATKSFSSSRKATGWMTDRGYIYVIMGGPDEIYRQESDTYGPPYETWYYYMKNRQYTFIDETGFGDFTLIITIYYEDSDMLN